MSRLRRAMLFMPGDDDRKIRKAVDLDVDSVIMDLEDGVAISQKAAGRQTIATALREYDFGRSERLVRINPVGSGFEMDDLSATVEAKPDAYVIPKVESAAQMIEISAWLDQHADHIALFPIIESALGIVNIKEIVTSSERIAGLMFGAEDFASSIGALRTLESLEVFYARSAVVLHAKAFGLQAIDSPYIDLNDLEGLADETRLIMGMGYDGKLCIHPKHVPIITDVFKPSAGEIERARALIAAHEQHQQQGTGVFAFAGRMIDMPMIRAAENILARADA